MIKAWENATSGHFVQKMPLRSNPALSLHIGSQCILHYTKSDIQSQSTNTPRLEYSDVQHSRMKTISNSFEICKELNCFQYKPNLQNLSNGCKLLHPKVSHKIQQDKHKKLTKSLQRGEWSMLVDNWSNESTLRGWYTFQTHIDCIESLQWYCWKIQLHRKYIEQPFLLAYIFQESNCRNFRHSKS